MYGNLIGDFFKDLEDQEQEKELEEITGKKIEKTSDEVNMAVEDKKTEYKVQSDDEEYTEDSEDYTSDEDDYLDDEDDLEEESLEDDFDESEDFDEDDLEEDLELDEEDLESEDNDFDADALADEEDDDLEEAEEDTEDTYDFDPDELADEEDDDLEEEEIIHNKPVVSSPVKPVEKVENIKANNVQAQSKPVVEEVKPIEIKNTTDTGKAMPENSSNYNFNKLKELEIEKQLLEKELEIKRLREALGESDKAHNSSIKAVGSNDSSIHSDNDSVGNSKSSRTVSTKRTQSGVVNTQHGRKRLFTKDDFASMEPETLLRFVESFMLKNNISHNTIPESVLVEKFGKEAIKKLVSKRLLVKFRSGFTLGQK